MSTHLDCVIKNLNAVVTGNKVKLKELYEKVQLESITLDDKMNLRSLKKELNQNGVKFSVMKDKGSCDYVVFLRANSRKILNHAFKNVLATEEQKRLSTLKTLATYIEKVAKMQNQDKTRKKQREKAKSKDIVKD